MRKTWSVPVFVFALALVALPARAETFVFLAGQDDNFFHPLTNPATPHELATPSAGLSAALTASSFFATQGFDRTGGLNGGTANAVIAHTFANLPAGIIAATLETRVRAAAFDLVANDGIVLAFADGSTNLQGASAFARSFGPSAGGAGVILPDPDTGLVQQTEWRFNNAGSITLDLAALPRSPLVGGGTFSILAQLNQRHFLDVVVADDSAADFYRLTVVTIPEPQSYELLLAGLGLLGFAARRRTVSLVQKN